MGKMDLSLVFYKEDTKTVFLHERYNHKRYRKKVAKGSWITKEDFPEVNQKRFDNREAYGKFTEIYFRTMTDLFIEHDSGLYLSGLMYVFMYMTKARSYPLLRKGKRLNRVNLNPKNPYVFSISVLTKKKYSFWNYKRMSMFSDHKHRLWHNIKEGGRYKAYYIEINSLINGKKRREVRNDVL